MSNVTQEDLKSMGIDLQLHGTYVQEEKYLAVKHAAQEALDELERLNKMIALNPSVIANLKNVLV